MPVTTPVRPLIVVAGIAAVDDIYPITTPLMAGEKHRGARFQRVLGGNAANAARAVCRLGGHSELLVRMGADDDAGWITRELEGEGIGLALSHPLAACSTSHSAIVIEPNGARTIANMFDPDFPETPEWMPRALPPATAAVLGDIRWEAAALQVLTLARAGGLPAVLDGDRAPRDLRLLEAASHIAFSAQGLRELLATDDISAAIQTSARGRASICLVTNGENGVLIGATSGAPPRHLPACRIKAVDTLGAGDVWHGAFTLALAERQPLDGAVNFANRAAALKCLRPGGGAGAPTRAELDAFVG